MDEGVDFSCWVCVPPADTTVAVVVGVVVGVRAGATAAVGVGAVRAMTGGADAFRAPCDKDGSGRLVEVDRVKLGLRRMEEDEDVVVPPPPPPLSSTGVRICGEVLLEEDDLLVPVAA